MRLTPPDVRTDVYRCQALLAALAALYAASFTSLLLQGPSLFGSGGLVPVEAYLKVQAEQLIGSADYTRESLLLEAGWAGILLAAQPGGASGGAGAPPALLLLRWQLFKACVLDGTAKLRVACAAAGDLGECFLRVAATAAVQGAPNCSPRRCSAR
ncbi:hypothetical protein MNEG_12312 [Monoraphidium neglectum]|uniref:Uncharacterized protein n=1 Tax=Monoraphidium neglectum TaxID=145388 RepID=A0A0D2M2X9_9CHLO|nr:hypothetical protein MNEG_12312 [Monoraphidium neglectum]KIY95651.1 hypothetical protein MNEG_12312 [Monoraphidium neglectum]|eukprot:XP_013894671.1 hypothetical protein MNEG_12312 [Monoraphidium neglectum]